MSITIRHRDGPLKDKPGEHRFDDTKRTLLIGRAPECDVVYPDECIAVDGEHFTLNRDDEGNYRIGLPGSCDVEIDGRQAEDGEKVASGSVIRVGLDGPTFEVLLPGVTIKHLEGPLAGTRQYFSDSVGTIIFGRSREEAQVIYPPDYAIVGVKHFALTRGPAGDYRIELFGKRYVAMDGRPVIDGAVVKSGSVFRLGKSDGPAFTADIAQSIGAYVRTAENEEMPEVGGWLYQLNKYFEALSARTKQIAAAVGALMLILGGVIGWMVYEHYHYKWVAAHTLQSVYLVVDRNDDAALATAFYVGDGMFATNAHVTEALRGKTQAYYLVGPKGDRIDIQGVESHPGYALFKARALTYAKTGSTSLGDFESMSLPSVYDVGIIRVDPTQPRSEPIEIDPAPELEVGEDVITAGFPSENIRGADNIAKGLAAATFREGNIESLKDIFFSKSSEDPEPLLMVQHGIPSTGGMSGSPIVDAWTGKVVAVLNGGNTMLLTAAAETEDGDTASPTCPAQKSAARITNPAQVNYAQRSDLLDDLINGRAQAALAKDQAYWEAAGAKYARYFDLALSEFLSGKTADREEPEQLGFVQGMLMPGVKDASELVPAHEKSISTDESVFETGKALKTASHTYSFKAEPGFEYGFIVDTLDALPACLTAVRLKVSQADPPAAEAEPAKKQSNLPLTATVAVRAETTLNVVLSSTSLRAPVRYTLYVYRWPLASDAATTGASPPQGGEQGAETISTTP